MVDDVPLVALEVGLGRGGGGAGVRGADFRLSRSCRISPATNASSSAAGETTARRSSAASRSAGVVLFPADTVYGLACDPDDRFAVERLYLLKRRTLDKPSAVMFFSLERAFAALPELGERTREAMARLLPGAVTVLVPNPAGRFALACGRDVGTLGVRVPVLPSLARGSAAGAAVEREPRRRRRIRGRSTRCPRSPAGAPSTW